MMPESQPKPSSEKKRSSTRRTTRGKNLPAEKTQLAYPSFAKPKSPDPLIKKTSNPLTDAGMALRRLGLTEKDIADVPEVTPYVKKGLGSVKEAITLIRSDDAPDSRKFIRKWDSLSAFDQKHARLEYVVTAAGLTTRRFMELLAGTSFDNAKMFAALSQLRVLHSTVKAATAAKGDVKAMEIFHKITGALPTPKGSSFIVNQQINAPVAPPEPKTPLQAMDSFLLEIDDVRRPKQLTASVEPEIPVEMPDNVPEIEYMDLGEVI